jgi:hypothetical protein
MAHHREEEPSWGKLRPPAGRCWGLLPALEEACSALRPRPTRTTTRGTTPDMEEGTPPAMRTDTLLLLSMGLLAAITTVAVVTTIAEEEKVGTTDEMGGGMTTVEEREGTIDREGEPPLGRTGGSLPSGGTTGGSIVEIHLIDTN